MRNPNKNFGNIPLVLTRKEAKKRLQLLFPILTNFKPLQVGFQPGEHRIPFISYIRIIEITPSWILCGDYWFADHFIVKVVQTGFSDWLWMCYYAGLTAALSSDSPIIKFFSTQKMLVFSFYLDMNAELNIFIAFY